jgi:hypothetical protein
MQIDLDQVRKFIEYERGRFDTDRKAIKDARHMANGNNWRESLNDIKTTLKHKVRVDAINQIINKICSKFTSNPFRFIAGDKQLNLDYNSFDTSIALAFRDSVVAGQGFIYVDYAAGTARRLAADSVIMNSSNSSSYVICVDKESKDYRGESIKDDNLGMGDKVIEYNPETEYLVFTVYQKTQGGILAAKVIGGEIEESDILPISEYPVIRIVAEEAWPNDKLTYRGLYYKSLGLSDLIDATFSRVASNILTAPRMKYWVASYLAASDKFHKSMSEMSKQDTAYAVYEAYDDQQRPIPPPVRDEGRILVDELVGVTDKMIQYINMLFGFETAEDADTGNKTAQEILFRKENQNANYSQYLFNLSIAIGNVCKIYESLRAEKVAIVSGPYENIYRQTSLQTILAVNDYCTMQPQRAIIAPLLIKFSSLDEETKAELNEVIQQQTNIQQLLEQSQQMQQQAQEQQGAIQQLQQQNAALQQQMMNSDKALNADMTKEQMRLADKSEDRAFKSEEAEKDRALELYKIELNNQQAVAPEVIMAAQAATDLNPHNTGVI